MKKLKDVQAGFACENEDNDCWCCSCPSFITI